VNCDKLNKVLSVSSSSYTAPRVISIKLEVEQVNFFLERFFTSLHNSVQSLIRSPSAIQSVYRHVSWQFISDGLICKLLDSTQLRKRLCWSRFHRWRRWFQAL